MRAPARAMAMAFGSTCRSKEPCDANALGWSYQLLPHRSETGPLKGKDLQIIWPRWHARGAGVALGDVGVL